MSNAIRRPALRGEIVLGDRVVGGVELPLRPDLFIEHFNREYGRLGLSIRPCCRPDASPSSPSPPERSTAA